jgi:hypothetical protein
MGTMDDQPSSNQDGDNEEYQAESECDQNRTLENQNESESIQNEAMDVPNTGSGQSRTAPNCSDLSSDYTITVREAARIFEEAGAPRTERAITKWCNLNARGLARLECCYNESDRKYYISTQSIDRVIKEERRKFQFTEYRSSSIFSPAAEDLSEQIQNDQQKGSEIDRHSLEQQRNASRQTIESFQNYSGPKHNDSTNTGDSKPESEDQLKQLQIENYDLRVQLEGQRYLIRKFDELVDGERERYEVEKMALVDRLTNSQYQIGTLEQKLLQIEAPRNDIHDADKLG